MLDELSNQGFLRARVDGKVIYLDELSILCVGHFGTPTRANNSLK
jgi:hypothetical protein